MSRKRSHLLPPAAPSRSICEIDDDDNDTPSSAPQQQLTLNTFFLMAPKRRRNIRPVTPASKSTEVEVGGARTVSPALIKGTLSSPKEPPRKEKRLQQVYLDCGQSDLGQSICAKCGMLYVPGVAEDVQAHTKICRERCEGISWRSVQGQRIHSVDGDSSITSITISKSKPKLSSVLEEVYEQVVQDLGMDGTASLAGYTLWLFLRKHRVVGFLATQPVSTAYLLSDDDHGSLALGSSVTTAPIKVMLGVAILWTHDRFRQQGVATKLVTAARNHSFFGMRVPTNKVAFSTPTQAGWSFAKKYFGGTNQVLVYKYQQQPARSTAGE